nr:sugar kinase [uncultured Caproiciproducens sp.]
MSQKIMLVGEPMGLFIAQDENLLERVNQFSTAVAGAELNVAIGLTRLGHGVGYLTKLGTDPFGKRIVNTMKEIGIDTTLITFSENQKTGFMLKSKVFSGDPEIYYYRKNSAASTISKMDIGAVDFSQYGYLHMTGITPALSATTREASYYLMEKARENGMVIFFDPNLRPQLWPDKQTMVSTVNELARMADYILPGCKEGEILMGSSKPEEIAKYYLSLGTKAVIVKTGKAGAFAATRDKSFSLPTYPAKEIVDTVGAGDGFAAGIISAVAEGLSLEEAVDRGNAIGAIQVMNVGDNEGLPTRGKLYKFMQENRPEI